MEISRTAFRRLYMLILISILSYLALQNMGSIWAFFIASTSIFKPVILGMAFAFVLNVPMSSVEKHVFDEPFFMPKERRKALGGFWQKVKRPLSLLCALGIIVGILLILIFVVIPALVTTISDLVSRVPDTAQRAQDALNRIFDDNPKINEVLNTLKVNLNDLGPGAIKFLKEGALSFAQNALMATTSALSIVTQVFLSFILAIYILTSKEKLQAQFTDLLYACFKRKHVGRILSVLSLCHRTFTGYISGQFLEACILGLLTLIGMTILRLPFAPVIAVLVVIMAMIPIVGSLISTVVGAILMLTVSPTKALIFVIFFILLQQLEGNLIYPHVVGKSVKLPGLWVLCAITVGGSFAGVPGMLVSIPTFSVLYTLTKRWIIKRNSVHRRSSFAERMLATQVPEDLPKKPLVAQAKTHVVQHEIIEKNKPQPVRSQEEFPRTKPQTEEQKEKSKKEK